MKSKPDYTEYVEAAGGEVRYYEENGKWRYICEMGEGMMLDSLEAAQEEVRKFIQADKQNE